MGEPGKVGYQRGDGGSRHEGRACEILRGRKGWEKAELCSGQLVRSPFGNEIGSWEKVKHH